jgi:hypothetical protein
MDIYDNDTTTTKKYFKSQTYYGRLEMEPKTEHKKTNKSNEDGKKEGRKK